MTKHILFITLSGLMAGSSITPAQTPSPAPQRQTVVDQSKQRQLQKQQEEAACAVCAGGAAFMGFVVVGIIALNIAMLVWVARDAKSRGMDSSILWMLLVMFTSVIGLLIYLFSRPQGELVQCSSCKGKRLKVSASCPHCHHA